ncbi:MAG: chemotaxis protein CheW [Myxococcota bacterium]
MSASLLVFEVRGAEKAYAIDVERVLNVIEPTVMTPVPLLPGLVRGIVSHRGRIVTVVDAGVLLKAGARAGNDVHVSPNLMQVLVLRDGSRDTGNVGLEVGKIRTIESAESLGEGVVVVDSEAMRAELELRVVDAIASQGVLR